MDQTTNELEEEAKELVLAFANLGLCYKCWRAFVEMEDNPKLAKRMLRWVNGDYSSTNACNQAAKRIQVALHGKEFAQNDC